jgi:hypothetical protein
MAKEHSSVRFVTAEIAKITILKNVTNNSQ